MESEGWLETAGLAETESDGPLFAFNVGDVVDVHQYKVWRGRIVEQHLDE